MKMKICAFLCVGILGVSLLTGCGAGGGSAEEQEARAEGIEKLENGEYEEAVTLFDTALENTDDDYSDFDRDVLMYKALALFQDGKMDEAISVYDDLISADSGDYKPYYLRGCIWLKKGAPQKAKNDFQDAISLNPNDYDLYIHIYEACREAGETENGQSLLREALDVETGNRASEQAEADSKKGYIHFLLGESDEALKLLDEAIDRDEVPAMKYKGIVLAAKGDTDGAKKSFDEYLVRCKKDAEAIEDLGDTAVNCGMADAAIVYYQKAQDILGKNDAEVVRKLIGAYEKNGDYATALETAEGYLEVDPDDAAVKKEVAFLKTRVDNGNE